MNAWQSFLLRYALVGLLGAALIVVLIPQAQQSGHGPRLTEWFRVAPRAAEEANEANEPAPERVLSVADRIPVARTEAPQADGLVSEGWGVVARPEGKTYSTNGTFLGRLEAGALVRVLDVRENRSDLLAVCRQASGDGERFLMHAADLRIRPGLLDAVSEEERRARVLHARLIAGLDALSGRAGERVRMDNPHASAFVRSRDAYIAYGASAKDLTVKRDAASGPDRMAYADRLQVMRGEGMELQARFRKAKRAYDEWNESHPAASAGPATVAALQRELAAVERHLESFGGVAGAADASRKTQD